MMASLRPSSIAHLPIAFAVLLSGSPAVGDITLEERVRLEGDGHMQMFNMTTRTVTTISGDRARTDTDMQMESRMMRMFGGSGSSAEIVRLDQERVYHLDPKKRSYTESSFEEQRAEMQRAMDEMREAQRSQQQGASGIDESTCDWSEATSSSERTGEVEQIAGFPAQRHIVTATQSCADRETAQVCDFRLTLDQWLTTEYEATDEALAFYRAYTEKLGLGTAGSRDFAQRLESMYAGYAGIWGEIAAHMEAVEGYPLRSSVALAIGGPQCQSMQQARASGQGGMPGVGEALGGAIGGAIGGMFGRKRDSERAAASTPAQTTTASADQMVRFMTINTELVSVSTAAADPNTFDVPPNYKLMR